MVTLGPGQVHALANVAQAFLHPGGTDFIAVGAIGGLAVGFGGRELWIWSADYRKRKNREREQERILRREFEQFFAPLRLALDHPEPLNISNAEGSAPPIAVALRDMFRDPLLMEHMIDSWRDKLPSERTVLDALRELQRANVAFMQVARKLDRRLFQVVADYNASHRLDPIIDTLDLSFIMGRMIGLPDQDVLTRIGLPQETLGQLRARGVAALADDQVAALVPPFMSARARLLQAVETLRTSLAEPVPAGRRLRVAAGA
jgi:hypothetical protein